MVIETYVKKFAKGGRNSKLWNGPTSLETKENFISFNFQSLLAFGGGAGSRTGGKANNLVNCLPAPGVRAQTFIK